jgi:uncharacterized protein
MLTHKSKDDCMSVTTLLRKIFRGPLGLRCGWGLAIYAATVVVIYLACWQIAFQILKVDTPLEGSHLPFMHYQYYALLLDESILLLAALGATWLMSRVKSEKLTTYFSATFNNADRLLRFLSGAAVGAVLVASYIGIIYAADGYRIGASRLHGWSIALYGAAWVGVAAVYGVADTILIFGYPLTAMRKNIGVQAASVLAAIGFVFRHILWFDASVVSFFALLVQGLLLCAIVFRYGTASTAGVYVGSVFAQDFLFSVSDSGTSYTGHPRDSYFEGPFWLTGVSGGAKASLPALAVYLLALVVVLKISSKGRKGGELQTAQPYPQ